MLFNAHFETVPFALPVGRWGERWEVEVDTANPILPVDAFYKEGDEVEVEGRSLVVLRRTY